MNEDIWSPFYLLFVSWVKGEKKKNTTKKEKFTKEGVFLVWEKQNVEFLFFSKLVRQKMKLH